MNWLVTVNGDKCTGCCECVDSCPGDVFEIADGCAVTERTDDCHGCHTCEEVCEEDAVQVEEGE